MVKDKFDNYRLEVRLYKGVGEPGSPYEYIETVKKGKPTIAMYYEAKKYAQELNEGMHGPVYTWDSWESPKYHVELIQIDNNKKVTGIYSSSILKTLSQLQCPHISFKKIHTLTYEGLEVIQDITVSTCLHCNKTINE